MRHQRIVAAAPRVRRELLHQRAALLQHPQRRPQRALDVVPVLELSYRTRLLGVSISFVDVS